MEFPYRYGVFAHETAAGEQLVHKIFILKLAFKLYPVSNSIPRFDADKGCILAVRTPYPDSRCLEINSYFGLVFFVQKAHFVELTVVKDNSIVFETLFCKLEYTVFGGHSVVFRRDSASSKRSRPCKGSPTLRSGTLKAGCPPIWK